MILDDMILRRCSEFQSSCGKTSYIRTGCKVWKTVGIRLRTTLIGDAVFVTRLYVSNKVYLSRRLVSKKCTKASLIVLANQRIW